jgi:hypothetical protein
VLTPFTKLFDLNPSSDEEKKNVRSQEISEITDAFSGTNIEEYFLMFAV